MNFKIKNNTGSPIKYENEVHSLCDFAQNRLGFKKPPNIFLDYSSKNAANVLGKTGYYDPNTMEIHVCATGRHPKDILRSIAHELVHHNQNMNGEFDDAGYSGKGYAQKNPHLRKMELDANDPMLFRDWEDSLKEKENTIYNERRNRKMSSKEWKNKEIGDILTGKWGFKMNLGKLSEAKEKEDKKPDEDGDGIPDYAEDEAKEKEKPEEGEGDEEKSEDKPDDEKAPEGEGDSGLTAAQKKLPKGLQDAIKAKKGKK